MNNHIRIHAITLFVFAALSTEARADTDCADDFRRQISGLSSFLQASDAIIIEDTKALSERDRQHYFSKLSMELTRHMQKADADMLTPCGMIADDRYAEAWNDYRMSQLGLAGIKIKRGRTHGFDIGRRLIDVADFSGDRHTHKVPFILSYSKDRLSGESSLSALGTVAYRIDGLASEHRFYTALAVNSADPVEESIVNLGYKATWRNVFDRSADKSGDRWIDDLETSFGVEWNTDRDFRRRAYSASIQFTPGIDDIGAGGYVNRAAGFQYVWGPSLKIAAGNVIDANGHAGFAAMKDNGGFVQATPVISASIGHVRFPKLQLGLEYGHTFDLSDGMHKGFFGVSASYKLTDSVRMTAIYQRGYEPPFFQEIDQVLFGFGITY